MGKNQVEIKDNHGHIAKVHRRDVKKIPVTEKVCKLYEEEQAGKTREVRKAVPNSKMPDLVWDIAETQLTIEAQKENNLNITPLLQMLVMVIVLIIAIVKQTTAGIKKVTKKAAQMIEASHNRIIKNIKDFHRNVMSAITIATNTTNLTNHKEQARINKKTTRYFPGTQTPNNEYDESYQSITSKTYRELTLMCHLLNFKRINPNANEQTRTMAAYMYCVLYEQSTGIRASQTGCATDFKYQTTPFKRLITGKRQPGGPGRSSEARGGSSRSLEEVAKMEGAPPGKRTRKTTKSAATAKATPKGRGAKSK